ncbi:homoserine dehydrogenase [Aliiroseovarius subalbicans]|uniref:homoserine dehydrogenase n=1 Tax=Aliiroseovarius subalbicans TaxID=2925840 RepID=UPI001F58AD43|nr:homoserine dehydrogenase [Aliiroseovarius subalbicans]MCI2398592.1 homoserine dehydrogenase [Aliiroseovarius subalbicans]
MTHPLRLGIAGLGTVGIGVVKIVTQHGKLLEARTGRPIEISAVSARSRSQDRGVDLSGFAWEDDPVALATRDDVDVYVELMGGSDGPAKASVEAAVAAGKHVVTANKALLAHHGQELGEAAEAAGVMLRFEAAVAGGIPIIKSLTEGLAGNEITRVMGVMNGTCNYILTRMYDADLPYDVVFEEANQLGYLEADPTLDVGGIDAGHKLALLASIAFGTQVNFDAMELEGIERIQIEDIEQAAEMGYRIKLLGVAQMTGRGLEQRMSPCLVPATSPLGQLEGGTNMVVVEGDSIGQVVLRGPGAGEGPTASAVMGDVIDLGRGLSIPTYGQPANTLRPVRGVKATKPAPYYLRLSLQDKPGALAKVAAVLGEAGVSINRMRQHGHDDKTAPVTIVSHKTTRDNLDVAIAGLEATGVMAGHPVAIRIEEV